MNNYKQLLEINEENVGKALSAVNEMVTRRGFVLTGELPKAGWMARVIGGQKVLVPKFTTKHQAKKFRKRMNRVITHATMPTSNSFLRHLGDARVDYTPKEKAIREARKKYREAIKLARETRTAYLIEKGDFYGGRIKVAPAVQAA